MKTILTLLLPGWLTLALAAPLPAQETPPPPPAGKITLGLVNVDQVMKEYRPYAERIAELEKHQERELQKLDEDEEALGKMEQELKLAALDKESELHVRKRQALELEVVRLNAAKKELEKYVTDRRVTATKKMIAMLAVATGTIAKERGIKMVLKTYSPETTQIEEAASIEELMRHLVRRLVSRTLHRSQAADITGEVLAWMNAKAAKEPEEKTGPAGDK